MSQLTEAYKSDDLKWIAKEELTVFGRVSDDVSRRLIEEWESATSAIEAIKARIQGEWDNPALMAYGPLSTSTEEDLLHILEQRPVVEEARRNEVSRLQRQERPAREPDTILPEIERKYPSLAEYIAKIEEENHGLTKENRQLQMQYAGTMGLVSEMSGHLALNRPEDREPLRESIMKAADDWCQFSGWTGRMVGNKLLLEPPQEPE